MKNPVFSLKTCYFSPCPPLSNIDVSFFIDYNEYNYSLLRQMGVFF